MASKRTPAAKNASSASGRRKTGAAAKGKTASPAKKSAGSSGASSSSGSSARKQRIPIPTEPSPVERIEIPNLSPGELYRKEKQRRSQQVRIDTDPIAEARREYLALLAAEAEKGKGGRPKGSGKKKEEPVEADED